MLKSIFHTEFYKTKIGFSSVVILWINILMCTTQSVQSIYLCAQFTTVKYMHHIRGINLQVKTVFLVSPSGELCFAQAEY